MADVKILILFSSKCAGSSAFQSYLEENYKMKTLEHAAHFEKETLYWTKVASVLGLPQEAMHRSQIPYTPEKASMLLLSFLRKNGISEKKPVSTKEKFFEHFFTLSEKTGIYIIEKSPHHLFNESNIKLIQEFSQYIAGRAEVHFIGLVRNPMDTIYSAWSRWRFNCNDFEREWFVSYKNLKRLSEGQLTIKVFKYEEIVQDSSALDSFMENHVGIMKQGATFNLTTKSLYRWKQNKAFRHRLQPETKALADFYGYLPDMLHNPGESTVAWEVDKIKYALRYVLRKLRKKLK